MRVAQIAVLAAGVGLAGFGVYMAQTYVAQTEQAMASARAQSDARPAMPTVELLVATRPLRYGEPIRAEDVRSVPWPETARPEGAFVAIEELLPNPQRPRIALRAMEAMEPILAVKVSEPGQPAGIAAQLAPGMRAFTMRVDAGSGISGNLRPSDLVDVYWTGRAGDQGEVTRLIVSGLRTIALDDIADQDRNITGTPRTVTIEAAPEVVATLAQGQATGRLSLSVVGLDDSTSVATFQIDHSQLLGIEAQAQTVTERCTVRTRRGGEVVETEIPCTN
ncbi:Flp pilus assembly protein CpaB [Pararhodobacter sp. SW119]|uniref:Flp pilus assembly protein CpaB n=1 Tax=Pararhodobacter sp. SW119 TaxID=2780075 RepID=UPI001AE0BA06|nr:Flp pilus assembly protein CpaB [Pararhodobacter sp. SW119]